MPKQNLLALDVGDKRIGVAMADSSVRIAVPYETIEVDGKELIAIIELIERHKIDVVVVGNPRNQSGEETKQTQKVKEFVGNLRDIDAKIVFQDESMTSVLAEEQLARQKKPYTKADIDSQAACLILNDYMEANL